MQRTKIIQEEKNYLYAEFTSALMGYVDDVEFYLHQEEGVIHVRSASRLGHSDAGTESKTHRSHSRSIIPIMRSSTSYDFFLYNHFLVEVYEITQFVTFGSWSTIFVDSRHHSPVKK